MDQMKLKNYIGGKWIESSTKEFGEIYNPAKGEIIARVPLSTKEEVNTAVNTAKQAFERWRATPAQSRIRYLFQIRDLMEKHFDNLAKTISLEHGKPLDESRGECRRAIENVESALSIPLLQMGYNFEDIASGIDEVVVRQPLGVFFCVAPFNFPLMVPTWFWPYAIATGNTYIVKASDQCPMSMATLFELIHDHAKIPKGVLNLVHGGPKTVSALINHPDTVGFSFVGSTKVGKLLYKDGGRNGKRMQVQGGAKNFIVILPDADFSRTIPNIITSFFGNTGQRCLAGGALILVGKEFSEFKKQLINASIGLTIGNGMLEGTQVGPLASKRGLERVLKYIEKGVEEGASLLLDGRETVQNQSSLKEGYYLGPTIFDQVTPTMAIAQEEIFGPVIPILEVNTMADALRIIDANPYGNAASIFTSSGKEARNFQYKVKAGNIGINVGVAAPLANFPFSGMKDSFLGDLHGQGKDVVRFFTEDKVVITRWF